MKREWEKWDKPGVAVNIHQYWLKDVSGLEESHRDVLTELVREYVPRSCKSVLEVGSGTGLIYERLVPAVIDNSCYTGVDISSEMMRIARTSFPQGNFIQGDAFALGFKDGAFDTVFAFEVLGHIPEIRVPIAEMIRVAGRLAMFTVWVSPTGKTVNRGEKFSG